MTDEAEYFLDEPFFGGRRVRVDATIFERFLLSVKTVNALREIESLFNLVAESLIAFERYLLNASLDTLAYRVAGREVWDRRHNEIDLRILTILTAVRAYHDQRKHLLGQTLMSAGDKSAVETEFNKAFDRSFGYRLMETLRNYAQHRRLPLGGYSERNLNESRDDKAGESEPSRLRLTIDPHFSRKKLLEGRSAMRSATMNELEALEFEQLDVKYLLRRYIAEISVCHEAFREHSQNSLGESETAFVEMVDTFRNHVEEDKDQSPRHMVLLKLCHDENADFYADMELVENLKLSRERWRDFQHFSRAYCSSQLVFRKKRYSGSGHKIWIPK